MARLKAPKQSGNKFTAFADKLGPLVYEGLRKRGFTSRAAYDNVMSQLAWESTYGTSDVARNNHNYGGYGYDGNGNYTVFKNDRDFIDAYLNTMSSRYRKALVKPSAIDPWIALAVIVEEAKGETSIQLNNLLNNPCNIGKVFNLDAIAMLEILHSIEKIGKIKIIRTAGLDIITINEKLTFLECVENYYRKIR